MKKSNPAKKSIPLTVTTLLALLLAGGATTSIRADDAKPDAPAATNVVSAAAAPVTAKAARAPLTGAELYSMHCNRCHPERYPTERTAAQWKTIMLHMQVRASIPAKQSRLILQYLQENSGR
ncbi:MAG: hypothetical protein P4N60_17940 [Verrucomicrobiae bacterium]|nr:hypothetical protein [Verrucomicrobiae bacterium]